MVNKPLDMKYIYKRDRYLEKRKSVNESGSSSSLDIFSSPSKMQIETFLNSCPSYNEAVSLLENLYSEDNFSLLEASVQKVINEVIPTIENKDLYNFINCVESSNIGDFNKDRLIETANMYKSIDRIRKNHKNLSKKFTLEAFTNKAKSDKDKFFSICEMVDTYKLDNYIKMNIVFEETMYMSYVEGVNINSESMVENVLNYFLLREDNTLDDILKYRDCITKSKVIPNGSDSRIQWYMEMTDSDNLYADIVLDEESTLSWSDKLNTWKLSENKSSSDLLSLINENLSNIYALRSIVETYNDFISINELESNLSDFTKSIPDSISGVNEASNIINILKENCDIDGDLSPIIESLNMILEENINDEVYANAKIDKENPKTFTTDEIDKFKMHNLITDAQAVGEFLDQVDKTSTKELPVKMTTILSPKYDNDDSPFAESTLIDYIDSNAHISLNTRSYQYDGTHKDSIYEFANTINNCINNILYNRDSLSYYILGENSVDFYIRSKYDLALKESDILAKGFSKLDKKSIVDINRISNILESFIDSPYSAIMDTLQDRHYAATVSADEAALVMDIMSPYIDRSTITEFVNLCKEEGNNNYYSIKTRCNDTVLEDFDIYEDPTTRLEFCANNVMGLNEDVVERAKNNLKSAVGDLNVVKKIKDKKEASSTSAKPIDANKQATTTPSSEENKEQQQKTPTKEEAAPKKDKFTVTDAKLAWQGVKAKLKDASAKEKEISRDVDMEFNNLCKNIENTYSVDHREEIITGQVNRSLSKIIKMAISLAGIGAIAGTALHSSAASIAIPAIMAVTGFAKSAHTTYKEKKLILDEIDIELQVLDREISRAESSGSSKKYRQLLTIQKNLQRRRQEIYYNLAKKGRKIPMVSTQGLRERE